MRVSLVAAPTPAGPPRTRVATVSTPPASPAALLRRLVAADPGRPRVTVYDDTDSPTRGERIELSARVLANWVAKAANLLRDDLDAGPGSVVLLDLPPHWRTLYWAVAAWSVGACVEVPAHRTTADAGPGPAPAAATNAAADVVVTDAVDVAAAADEAVLVTLAALARSAAGPVPTGVVDEARELATHGDVFDGVGRAGRQRPRPAFGRRGRRLRGPGGGTGAGAGRRAAAGAHRHRPTRRRSSGWPWRSGQPTARWW